MSKRFLIILAVCVLVFVGLVVFKKDAEAPNDSNIRATNHVSGNGPVRLVEFGDLQCPACALYFPLLKQVKAQYSDKITFQFKHFPLVSSHPNAMSAHRAAEAAARQEKFWEMHDLIYERQDAWENSNNASAILEGYAQELGLDMEKFKQDVASSEVLGIINADMKEGQAVPVTSTPTFVIDGKKLDPNPSTIEEFGKVIDEALKAKNQQ